MVSKSLQQEPLPDSGAPVPGEAEAPPVAPTAAIPALGALSLLDASGDVRPLEEIEAEAIRFAITHYRGQMSEAARRLRIGRSTLYRKLDSLDPFGRFDR
jgi:DNA-binding NtrC family response regulator